MSITDELRKWFKDHLFMGNEYVFMGNGYAELTAIADRIDIAHKHAIGYVDDRDPETMAENGWVRLPKDADGEYIHIGDVMAYADNTKPMVVVALVPPAVFLTEDGPRYADMCRHYHKPTVEDVLREFAERYLDYEGVPSAGRRGIGEALMDEYAAKLRLAGDAE